MASVTLTWNDVATVETGYRVQQSLDGQDWTTLVDKAANSESHTVTGLANSTLYYFRVGAIRGGIVSWCPAVSVTTAPVAPGAFAVTPLIGQVQLDWEDNCPDETGYKVQKSTNGTDWTDVTTTAAGVETYTVGSLINGTLYYFRVGTVRGSFTIYSSALTATPGPNAPSNLVLTPSTTSVQLDWDDNSSTEDGFAVQQWNGSSWNTIHTTAASVETYSVTGLSQSTSYTFRVVAVRGALSNPSDSVTTATLPAAPSSVNITNVTFTSLRVNWTDNSTGETQFKVERSPDGSTGWSQVATPIAGATHYDDTGLTTDTVYYYRVRAFDGTNNSAYSGTANATTLFNPELYAIAQGGLMKHWLDFDDLSTLFQDSAGATPVTVANGTQPIGRINNKIAGGPNFAQATSGNKPTATSEGASADGGDFLASSSSTYSKFLHDGTRVVVIARCYPSGSNPSVLQALLDNNAIGSSNVGFVLYHNDTGAANNRLGSSITSGVVVASIATNDTWTPNTMATVAVRFAYGDAGNDLIGRVNGSQVVSAESVSAPSASNPTNALTIFGRSGSFANGWTGACKRIWVFTDIPDSAIATLETKIAL